MASERVLSFAANVHCPTCVTTATEALAGLEPPPSQVYVNLVNQTITLRHDPRLAPDVIAQALADAGFELDLSGHELAPGRPRFSLGRYVAKRKRSRLHQENCQYCRVEHERRSGVAAAAVGRDAVSLADEKPTARIQLPSATTQACAARLKHCLVESYGQQLRLTRYDDAAHTLNLFFSEGSLALDEIMRLVRQSVPDAILLDDAVSPLIGVAPPATDVSRYRVSYSIGGMTCASCSGNITASLMRAGFDDACVNLLAHSGSATIRTTDQTETIKRTIEDMGYDCEIDTVEPLDQPSPDHAQLRTVVLRIDGLTDFKIVDEARNAIQQLHFVHSVSTFTLNRPSFLLTYQPLPPDDTLRRVIEEVKSVEKSLKISIENPPSLEERVNRLQRREQISLLIRLFAAFAFAVPSFVIGVVFMMLLPKRNPHRVFWMTPVWGNCQRGVLAMFALATPVQFIVASHFHVRSYHSLMSLWRPGNRVPILRRFVRFGTMDLLVSLGTFIAYFASIAMMIISICQESNAQVDHVINFFDTSVFLTMFILAGRFLESYTKHKAADAVNLLGGLRPSVAILDSDGSEISASLLEIGDVIRVPGGCAPAGDGVILTGNSLFDESSLTGEAKPQGKDPGDKVYTGTINLKNSVTVKLEAIGGSAMLDQIVQVVRQGQTNRAPIQKFADVLTGYFVPCICLIAVVTFIVWLLVGISGALPESDNKNIVGGWTVFALQFAIATLVIACPCGIGLAAPTASFVGSGLAARYGILVQGGGEAFQEVSNVDCIVFDKTGTLTIGGQPQVTDEMIFANILNIQTIKSMIYQLESHSSHALAVALCANIRNDEIAYTCSNIEESPGRGMSAFFSRHDTNEKMQFIVGNERWMEEHEAKFPKECDSTVLEDWKTQGKSVVLAAAKTNATSNYFIVGQFAIVDAIRPEAKRVVDYFHQKHIQVWMITGDNETTALSVARQVNIPDSHVIAGVLPHEKGERVKWLQKTAKPQRSQRSSNRLAVVAMVGDGINDAPALAVANVSIAIGSGTDIAISSAKFVLLQSNLGSIITLLDLSRTVFRRIKINFVWALLYNCIGIPIAAGVLYPIGLRLDAVWGALAMALSSVSVVLSSLALQLYRPPRVVTKDKEMESAKSI